MDQAALDVTEYKEEPLHQLLNGIKTILKGY